MLYNFFNIEECNEIIEFGETLDFWFDNSKDKLETEGFKYHFVPLNTRNKFKYESKINEVFEKSTSFKINQSLIRLLRFKRGENLPTHSYDYTLLANTNYYTDTKFCINIFLSPNNSKFYLNNNSIEYNMGEGIIINRTDRGKLDAVKSDYFYMLMSHIKTDTRLYAI